MQDLEENSEKGIENQECFLYNVNVILFVSENVARLGYKRKVGALMWPLMKKGLFETGRVLFLPLDAIHTNPNQPRRTFDQNRPSKTVAGKKFPGEGDPAGKQG